MKICQSDCPKDNGEGQSTDLKNRSSRPRQATHPLRLVVDIVVIVDYVEAPPRPLVRALLEHTLALAHPRWLAKQLPLVQVQALPTRRRDPGCAGGWRARRVTTHGPHFIHDVVTGCWDIARARYVLASVSVELSG